MVNLSYQSQKPYVVRPYYLSLQIIFSITGMLVDVTIHHGGRVQHNPFEYIGGKLISLENMTWTTFRSWKLRNWLRILFI
jgi:hypothetical protein